MRGKRVGMLLCCALVSAAVGCGGSSSTSSTRESAQVEATETTTTTVPSLAEQRRRAKQGELEYRARFEKAFAPNPYPRPRSPGPHPGVRVTHLIVRRIKRGSGPPLHGTRMVWADYIEANYTSGYLFESAWGPHRQSLMPYDNPDQMQGLIRGMRGMRPGERRVIIIPRQLSDTEPGDADRKGKSYREIVYFDVVLRSVLPPGS